MLVSKLTLTALYSKMDSNVCKKKKLKENTIPLAPIFNNKCLWNFWPILKLLIIWKIPLLCKNYKQFKLIPPWCKCTCKTHKSKKPSKSCLVWIVPEIWTLNKLVGKISHPLMIRRCRKNLKSKNKPLKPPPKPKLIALPMNRRI